jgi:general secretion pathway protein D
MRHLSLVALLCVLNAPAFAQGQPGSERSKRRRASRGKFDFKEQTYKLPKLLQLMGELTRKNFIVGKTLKNKEITIYCQAPVSIAEAYRVFVSALAAHKLSLVKVGKFYRVVKAKDAVKGPSPTFLDGRMEEVPYDERMVTVLHKLVHLEGDNLIKVLKKMVSASGSVQVVPPRLLLISDTAMNVHRLMRLVKHLDKAGATHQIHYYEARYADAGDLAAKLGEVFTVLGKKKKASSSKTKISAPSDVVLQQAVADDRTNTLIIVAEKVAFERAVELLDRLDLPTPDDEGAIHVLRLENADAKELASTLSSLISGLSNQKKRKSKSKKKKSSAGGASADGLFSGEVKVSADEATNSLVVVASRNDLRVLQRIIARLDYRRPQVFIEAAFLEISVKNNKKLGASLHSGVTADGTDWADPVESPWVAGALAGGAGLVGSTTAQGLRSVSPLSAAGLLGLVGTFQGISIPGLDEALGVKIPTFGVVFQALKTTTGVDVLSTPHLLTTDNEEAEITVGKNVPFASSMTGGLGGLAGLAGGLSKTSGSSALGGLGGLGLPSMSIQRQDVALKLKLTPHVTNTGQVRMEIEAEISELGGIEPTTNSPITTQRKIKTVVVASDSQTIVIGGLMADRKSNSVTKIPILGDLPLIGALFRSTTEDVDKTNLLLVLTPHIVRNDEDFARIFERKLAERREYAKFMSTRPTDFKGTMNWQRKVGPFARLDRDLERHLKAIENGGEGDGGESVVGADVTPSVEEAAKAVGDDEVVEKSSEPEASEPTPDAKPKVKKKD